MHDRMMPLPSSNIHTNLNPDNTAKALRNVTDEIDLSSSEISQVN
jgi:hypothetical protein